MRYAVAPARSWVLYGPGLAVAQLRNLTGLLSAKPPRKMEMMHDYVGLLTRFTQELRDNPRIKLDYDKFCVQA